MAELKIDGQILANRYRETLLGLLGVLLEMQVPEQMIRTIFEGCLNEAQSRSAKEHEKEIQEIVLEAMANYGKPR